MEESHSTGAVEQTSSAQNHSAEVQKEPGRRNTSTLPPLSSFGSLEDAFYWSNPTRLRGQERLYIVEIDQPPKAPGRDCNR